MAGEPSPTFDMGILMCAVLLCSYWVGCCFAQSSTYKVSHPAAAPILFEKAGHSNTTVNSTAGTVQVCYSCFFQNLGIIPEKKLIPYFQSVSTSKDPLISGDARFILWRATGNKDCGALDAYRR